MTPWARWPCFSSNPATSAVLTDFDGTLAPIVDDPEQAYALPDAPEVLRPLARPLPVVAVVSGRPVSFLAAAPGGGGPAVRLFGVYGLEWIEDGETRRSAPEVEPWLAAAAEVVAAARRRVRRRGGGGRGQGPSRPPCTGARRPTPAPGPRTSPETGPAAPVSCCNPDGMAVEFRPPVDIDKGSVVEDLARGCSAACFAGDDAGDLAAFAALDRLAARGRARVRVAVADEESPPELVAAADVVVRGPAEALDFPGPGPRARG